MVEFCFSTPLIIMHMCFASMMTAAPAALVFSSMQLAIWLVRFSEFAGVLQKHRPSEQFLISQLPFLEANRLRGTSR